MIDIIIIAFFAIMVTLGIIGRFSRQVVAIIEIALLVGAVLLTGVLGRAMFFNDKDLTGLGESMSGWFSGIGESLPGGDIEITNAEQLEEAIVDGGVPSFLSGTVTDFYKSAAESGSYKTIGDFVASTIGLYVLYAIVFIILLVIIIVCSVIVRRKINFKEIMNPTFRRYDRLIGAASALLIGYVVISILLGLVSYVANDTLVTLTESNGFTGWLHNNNFIGRMIFATPVAEEASVIKDCVVNLLNL